MVEPAQIRQELIVQSEDRVGLLANISCLLYEMGISILAVHVITDDGRAVVHLLTDAQQHARHALCDAGFTVDAREIVVIKLTHRPGFLCKLNQVLARKEVSILDLFVTAAEPCGHATLVFTTSNNSQAVQLLRGR